MKTILILILLALAAPSCTLTVAPDGSRTWAMDGAETARAIQVLSEK